MGAFFISRLCYTYQYIIKKTGDVMKMILIFGPQAVGKMTIGERISEKMSLPLMHNHVTLDAIWPYIGWNKKTFELSDQLRLDMFNYISKDLNHPGLIFTFVWAFDREEDWAFVDKIKRIFNATHHELYFIELTADLDERLRRNQTENRLLKKPSKRDIAYSNHELLTSAEENRLNSHPGEMKEKNYLKLDITTLSVDESSTEILHWLNEIEKGK